MQSWFCFGHVGCSPSTHGAAIKNMVMLFFYMIVGEIIIAWYFMFIFSYLVSCQASSFKIRRTLCSPIWSCHFGVSRWWGNNRRTPFSCSSPLWLAVQNWMRNQKRWLLGRFSYQSWCKVTMAVRFCPEYVEKKLTPTKTKKRKSTSSNSSKIAKKNEGLLWRFHQYSTCECSCGYNWIFNHTCRTFFGPESQLLGVNRGQCRVKNLT